MKNLMTTICFVLSCLFINSISYGSTKNTDLGGDLLAQLKRRAGRLKKVKQKKSKLKEAPIEKKRYKITEAPEGWPYTACNEIIEDQLFLGDHTSGKTENLKELGVTHVISVCDVVRQAEGVKYLYINIPDVPESAEKLDERLDETFDFINTALVGGGRVLVHCNAGMSRSATVVIHWY